MKIQRNNQEKPDTRIGDYFQALKFYMSEGELFLKYSANEDLELLYSINLETQEGTNHSFKRYVTPVEITDIRYNVI